MLINRILKSLALLKKNKSSIWIYGTCNKRFARKSILHGNVQFILWESGEQGHKEDFWHNFDESHWFGFEAN